MYEVPCLTWFYTLSLHVALPICTPNASRHLVTAWPGLAAVRIPQGGTPYLSPYLSAHAAMTRSVLFKRRIFSTTDRKRTRLNSSHRCISYAVFIFKKTITNLYDG